MKQMTVSSTLRAGLILCGAALVVALACVPSVLRSNAQAQAADVAHGRQLALQYCSGCHAVEPGKRSPVGDAPPFYTFGQRFPVDNLEEALAEGIMVGHENLQMPVFQFEPDDVADFIAYLKTIQQPAAAPPS